MTKYFSFNTSELQNELIKPEIIGDFPIYQDSPYQNDFLVIETNSMPRYERMTHNLEEKIFYNLAAMMEENKVKPIRIPQVMKESVTVWDKLKQGLKQLKKNVRDSIITGDKQSEDIPSNKFSMSLSAFGGNASILTNARGLLIIPLLSRRMCLLNLQVNWREFQFVEWHPTIKDSLALTFSNKVNIVKLGGDDELIHLRELEYSNVTVLKWSSNGE